MRAALGGVAQHTDRLRPSDRSRTGPTRGNPGNPGSGDRAQGKFHRAHDSLYSVLEAP